MDVFFSHVLSGLVSGTKRRLSSKGSGERVDERVVGVTAHESREVANAKFMSG